MKEQPQSESVLLGVVPALGETPGFQRGEQIRVAERFPLGHYRVPLYLRGKVGVVERLVQPAVDNEEEGFGRNAGMKRHYYRIGVPMTDIWPGYAGARQDRLCIEVFETWLDHGAGATEAGLPLRPTEPGAPFDLGFIGGQPSLGGSAS